MFQASNSERLPTLFTLHFTNFVFVAGIFVPVQDTEDLKKVASKQSKPIQETGDDDSEAATDSKDNKIPRYRVVRGLCLIMCSMPVNNALKVKMRKVFERLRFDVLYVEVGRKSFDLLRALEAYKGMSSRYDCFLCFVFSSGDERGVLGRDGEVVTVSQITGVFDVPELSGKPKLFILHLKQLDREIRACSDTNIAPNQGRMMDLFHVAQGE